MSNDRLVKVTVVVPSYNQGYFIDDTVQSILTQDYANIEVIVIDGKSTDGTLEVLSCYTDRIQVVSEQDAGQSSAINKGFSMATGDVVTWLNSDDIYPYRIAISTMVAAFAKNPQLDFLYGNFCEIDKSNRLLRAYKRPGFSERRLLRIGYISQPATFFRRRVIEAMSLREDLHYALDLEYWLRGASRNFKFNHIDFLMAAERLHEDAKCIRNAEELAEEAHAVRQSYGARFDWLHSVSCFADRVYLYILRLRGISALSKYQQTPTLWTVPLDARGAKIRTVLGRKFSTTA